MPTIYAHDLFGKKIYAKLPAEIQKVILQKYKPISNWSSWTGYSLL